MDFIVFFPLKALFSIELSHVSQSSNTWTPQHWRSANNIKSYLCPAGKVDANTEERLLPQFVCQTLFGPKGERLILTCSSSKKVQGCGDVMTYQH